MDGSNSSGAGNPHPANVNQQPGEEIPVVEMPGNIQHAEEEYLRAEADLEAPLVQTAAGGGDGGSGSQVADSEAVGGDGHRAEALGVRAERGLGGDSQPATDLGGESGESRPAGSQVIGGRLDYRAEVPPVRAVVWPTDADSFNSKYSACINEEEGWDVDVSSYDSYDD